MSSRKPVLYLSVHPQENYLVPPQGLPENFYSPGLFIIESDIDNLDDSYAFGAVDNGVRINLDLARVNGRFYKAKDAYDEEYYFVATGQMEMLWHHWNINVRDIKIKGRNSMKYSILFPVDSSQLENACKLKMFYFVGSVDIEE